ncbi:MAG: glycosyltransferase [Magnetococcus sp. DMHC-6]
MARWLVERVGIQGAKVKLIVNGVDVAQFFPALEEERTILPSVWQVRAEDFIIGTVGRFWPVKDHANLVLAFAHLIKNIPAGQRLPRLVLVGDGLLRGRLEELIHTLELDHLVWITGWRQDIAQLLRVMDLFVLPSLAEGTPMTILEAMATGLPVVATRVGGVPDLILEGKTGVLVPPANALALAKAMEMLFCDRELAVKFGLCGRENILQNFVIDHMIVSYQTLFQNFLQLKRRR